MNKGLPFGLGLLGAVIFASVAAAAGPTLLDKSQSPPSFPFPAAALAGDDVLAKAMPGLAKQVIAAYVEPDKARYLSMLFRMQAVAGESGKAVETIRLLTELRNATDPSSALALLPFEIIAKAEAETTRGAAAFNDAVRIGFRDALSPLDDLRAANALDWFWADMDRLRDDLRSALERQKDKDRISLPDALELIRSFHILRAFGRLAPLAPGLIAEDDAKRYVLRSDILIETPDHARLAAMTMRPRQAKAPLPTLLLFTIYADDAQALTDARKMAAHGYSGVVAYTRGKGRGPDTPVPYEHDGEDARAVIDWIGRQAWSDGRVGMYGGSYCGFTCWAAAKRLPAALKTIVPHVANNPGNGLPMENNIFLFVNYPWAFYVTNNKFLDNKLYNDRARWGGLNDRWYASGRPYREIDRVDGTPNPWLQRWLLHPSFDRYWQDMIPYKEEFAKINIPVLTVTGYYDDGQGSALGFLSDHVKNNPGAEHYLVIGPYDHFGAQSSRKAAVLRGYAIDPVAQIDTPELTFEWMDYVLRGGPKPALLRDRINYEVMGANEWRHAPSLEKTHGEKLTLYLTEVRADAKPGVLYRLSSEKPAQAGFLEQTVDFADRKTTNNNDSYPDPIVGKKPDVSNGFAFISEPFEEPVSIDGLFDGEIKAVINKKDVDIGVVLYEVMPDGELFHLSYFLGRASYARDMSRRRLLVPGAVETIPFERTRMVSRLLSKGSRLLLTLNVNRNPYAQINYGTGKDVSDEDISDAGVPLQVKWRNDSLVRIPITR
jgi:putative CocE/NonD family hydrolase